MVLPMPKAFDPFKISEIKMMRLKLMNKGQIRLELKNYAYYISIDLSIYALPVHMIAIPFN